ncbi:MAG: UbiA-like polyprenyltransferase [Armatimonadota bacterium]|nr:UbiA-like polyprenyltransferase [Armatimonadota bacterium]
MEGISKAPVHRGAAQKVLTILEMIKFEHTLFALPFALIATVVAARGMPRPVTLLWILVAMVGARSAAMAFNRLADLRYDRLNPRTSGRALVTGAVSTAEAWAFTFISVAIFVFAAYSLNRLAFALSPVALLVILGYSYTKRFTAWSHVVLGVALAIAPSGAWIAVTGRLDLAPVILSAAVALWTAGFDIIYSLQDVDFDRGTGLRSLPQTFGVPAALNLSRAMHGTMIVALWLFGILAGIGVIYCVGVVVVAAFLVYEHSLVSARDLSRVNMAFFTVNGFVSVGLLLFVVLDVMLR